MFGRIHESLNNQDRPMSRTLTRTRFGAAVAAAFIGGVLVASSLDFTHFGYAQGATATQTAGKPTSQQIKPLADAGNAFVAIAEHVTPAVVSIQTARDPRQSDTSPRMRGRVPPGLEDFFNQFGPQRPEPQEASGSGFIVTN